MPVRVAKVGANEETNETTVSVTSGTSGKYWNWSIHPLIIFSMLMGVDLTVPSKNSCRQKWKKVFCATTLIIHAAFTLNSVQIFKGQLHEMTSFFFGEDGNQSTAALWNVIIDVINFEIGCFGAHWILYFFITKRWASLCDAFQLLIPLFDVEFHKEFNAKFRRWSYYSLTFIVLGVGSLSILAVVPNINTETTFNIKFLAFSQAFFQIYHVLSITLFAIASYASSVSFQSIAFKLNGWTDPQAPDLRPNADLILLKRYHVLTCQTVDSIHHCFGWSLLFIVPHLFVAVINASFYWFAKTNENNSASEIAFFFFHLINLFVLCTTSDRVRIQSEKVIKEFIRLRIEPTHNLCRKQVHELLMQVVLNSPRVSALGFFNVSKKLIPTMIGTTLTYYFILRQFHSSEKKSFH